MIYCLISAFRKLVEAWMLRVNFLTKVGFVAKWTRMTGDLLAGSLKLEYRHVFIPLIIVYMYATISLHCSWGWGKYHQCPEGAQQQHQVRLQESPQHCSKASKDVYQAEWLKFGQAHLLEALQRPWSLWPFQWFPIALYGTAESLGPS